MNDYIIEKEVAIEGLQAKYILQREVFFGKSGNLAERIETLRFLNEEVLLAQARCSNVGLGWV